MKPAVLLLFLLTCSAHAAISNNHLVPSGGDFTDEYSNEYPQVLVELLRSQVPFSRNDSVFEVYVLPSWNGEKLLVFEEIRNAQCTRGAVVSLSSSLYDAMESKKPLPTATATVGCVTTNLICNATEVITRALVHSRYPDPPENGGDGVSFVYLAFVDGYGVIEGHTWSPDRGTPMFNLVALSSSLETLIHTPGDSTAANVAHASIDLLRKQLPQAVKANQPLHSDAACGRAGERQR